MRNKIIQELNGRISYHKSCIDELEFDYCSEIDGINEVIRELMSLLEFIESF